jgi:hypothetical protein
MVRMRPLRVGRAGAALSSGGDFMTRIHAVLFFTKYDVVTGEPSSASVMWASPCRRGDLERGRAYAATLDDGRLETFATRRKAVRAITGARATAQERAS